MNLLLPLILFLAPPNSATVTYSNPGARMEVVFPELSKLAGLKLRVSPKLADHVLILRLDKAPVAETLKRIAHAAYGQWAMDGEDDVLYPDAGRLADAVEASELRHQEIVRATLARIATAKQDDLPWMYQGEALEEIQRLLVFGQAVAAAFAGVDIEPILKMKESGRIVYSTAPTTLQLPLAPSTLETLVRALPPKPVEDLGGGLIQQPVPSPEDVAKVDVAIEASEDLTSFKVTYFDKNLAPLYVDLVWLGDQAGVTPKPKPKPTPDFKPLKVGPVVLDYLRTRFSEGRVTPALAAILRDPMSHDPDALIGEALVAWAKEVKRQLVAAPSDEVLKNLDDAFPAIDWDDASKTLAYDANAKIGDGTGWIEAPEIVAYPYSENSSHHSRRRIAKAMGELPEAEGATLVDVVRAWRDGLSDAMDLPQALLYPSLSRDAGADPTFLNLIENLDDDQIAGMMAGHSLRLGGTSPEFQSAFAALTDSSAVDQVTSDPLADPSYDTGDISGDVFDDPATEDSSQPEPPDDPRTSEYTERASSFAPPETVVRLVTLDSPRVAGRLGVGSAPAPIYVSYEVSNPNTKSEERGSDMVDFRNVAQSGGYSLGDLALFSPLMTDKVLLKLGTSHRYRLQLEFAPHLYLNEGCRLTTFAPGAKYGRLRDLPTNVLAILKRDRAMITKFEVGPGTRATAPAARARRSPSHATPR